MATYYVDDGGDGTTENSWATADTSINNLDAEYTFASGDIIYFGHDHVCQAVNTASLTITGPTSGAPTVLISATQGSSPPTYQASTTAQIDTTEGAYGITFDGSFALYGMSLVSGGNIIIGADANETCYAENSRFAIAANASFYGTTNSAWRLVNCVIDLTADGTTGRGNNVLVTGASVSRCEIVGLTFVNAAYRTGAVFGNTGSLDLRCSGSDFSGFTNATVCEIVDLASGCQLTGHITNCLTAATWTPATTPTAQSSDLLFTNVGSEDAPTYCYHLGHCGSLVSSTAVYRTSGATVEGVACSWLVTTIAGNSEASPYKSPWIYGLIDSTGSKTFTVYITNDTADFTDAEVWLEVEYLATADEAQYTLATDHRASLTATAAAQTDDVTSTWNGAGPSYTYKQSLAVTATVNETGTYRARVVCGVASVASSRYFYIDPKVTVS